ncbi:hypothetical protein OWV82_018675 [Melia azedarach]|uniref:Uncharacterized protein n=1 Tax=Melia azedarach TaxID=155640 RepID=A0ACC1XBA6_MELAZ|nr:hypothetical protein OWV82_018675 [Melia azedarach]
MDLNTPPVPHRISSPKTSEGKCSLRTPLLPFGFAWLGIPYMVSFFTFLSFFFFFFICAVGMSDAGESQHSPADSEAATPENVASSPISSSQTNRYKVLVGRGRSSVVGESSEEGADQSFFLDDEGTSVTAKMLA